MNPSPESNVWKEYPQEEVIDKQLQAALVEILNNGTGASWDDNYLHNGPNKRIAQVFNIKPEAIEYLKANNIEFDTKPWSTSSGAKGPEYFVSLIQMGKIGFPDEAAAYIKKCEDKYENIPSFDCWDVNGAGRKALRKLDGTGSCYGGDERLEQIEDGAKKLQNILNEAMEYVNEARLLKQRATVLYGSLSEARKAECQKELCRDCARRAEPDRSRCKYMIISGVCKDLCKKM